MQEELVQIGRELEQVRQAIVELENEDTDDDMGVTRDNGGMGGGAGGSAVAGSGGGPCGGSTARAIHAPRSDDRKHPAGAYPTAEPHIMPVNTEETRFTAERERTS
eukprot:4393402-Pyramimonas_sp.AAC.1